MAANVAAELDSDDDNSSGSSVGMPTLEDQEDAPPPAQPAAAAGVAFDDTIRADDGAQALPTRANCHGDDSLSAGDGAAENLLASFKVVLAALAGSHRSAAHGMARVADRPVLAARGSPHLNSARRSSATRNAVDAGAQTQRGRADLSIRDAAPAVSHHGLPPRMAGAPHGSKGSRRPRRLVGLPFHK